MTFTLVLLEALPIELLLLDYGSRSRIPEHIGGAAGPGDGAVGGRQDCVYAAAARNSNLRLEMTTLSGFTSSRS